MSDPRNLDGKVAIVTGATGGIGEATAKLMLQRGAKVMLVGRNASKLDATRDRLAPHGACKTAIADSTDEQAIAAAVIDTVEKFGALDIMVANAGTEGDLKPIEKLTVDEFRDVLDINVVGVWLAMKYAADPIRNRGGGAIVAISSIAGMIGFPAMAPYISSKHAVFGLVKTAALEFGPDNIRVNAVGPGPIDNRMMQSVGTQLGDGDEAAVRAMVTERIALGRYGTNEEIAELVTFLSSDAAAYCNGGMYLADGGFVAA